MSIRTNPMKAVAVLLKRVRTARSIFHERARDESFDGKLEQLTWELNKIKEVFMRVKKNEEELLDTLTEVDGHLRKLDRKKLNEEMDGICKRIRDSAHKLVPMDILHSSEEDHNTPSPLQPSSSQHNNEWLLPQHVDLTRHMLQYPLRRFLLSLSIFLQHAVIKKRQTIYWWIGEGLVRNTREKTAEELGEDVIDQLLKFKMIVPHGNGKCPVVNKFKINPRIQLQLLSGGVMDSYVSREYAQHLGFYLQIPVGPIWLVLEEHKVILDHFKSGRRINTFLNIGSSYLNFGSQWMDKMKYLYVLHLGCWQDSPLHHIEVGSEKFLKELRDQKQLKYLSLRGISRISELPPCIAQLESLQVLDLKACHNLEKVPDDISSMKSLTHLILSQCYLLEGMPKGIEKLTQLQVLKGFVLGSSRKTPCKISDIANLKKLRHLSIHIGSEAVIKDREFEGLGELHLKISWGMSDTRYNDIQITLSSSLKKLHLECFPGQKIPEWLKPSKLPGGLKELKIKGGKLENMNPDGDINKWSVEIVRLRYLKYLKVDLTNLQKLFPMLRYAEIKKILNHSDFEWSVEKRVRSARSIFMERARDESFDAKLEKLTGVLNKIKEVFMRVKKNEEELLDTLNEVDGHLRKLDRKMLDEEMDGICKRIRDSAHKLLPMEAFDSSQDDHNTEKLHSHTSSTQHNNQLLLAPHVNMTLDMLENPLQSCMTSLSIFPEHAVIKKRQTIYWWIGEGFVKNTTEKTAEELGEDVIDQLLKFNMIVPYGTGKCPVVKKFQINPQIRPELELYVLREKQLHLGNYFRSRFYFACLVLEQQKVILGDGVRSKSDNLIWTVFNVNASYLNFGSQWLDEMKYIQVLQLGRWQDSPSHHIEVGSEEFLKELRDQKYLKYLSLRGISRISEMPPSIAQLEGLQVLDLKACHNLETLPNDIASMKSLTHLILSQCYLLEGMPKGIEKLTQLQVLKGFVLGSSRKTPYKISDLSNLKKLRQLGMHIGSEAVIKDKELESLGELSALEHLKISWSVSDTRYGDIHISLPSSLKKLHLECFPGQKIPEWLKPSKLPRGFKELKIKGGQLQSMNHDDDLNKWGMQIVRLNYLKHLKVDLTNLQELFPLLKYAEIKQILNHSDIEWSPENMEIPLLLKRVRTARTIFHERARDESFDAKLEKLTLELNKIKEVFMRVKKNEEELLDTLNEVDGHIRKLDRKRLDEEMDGICKRIRDSAHKLLPMDAFHSSQQDHNTQILHSHDPSSTHHNNQLLLPQHVNVTLDGLIYHVRLCLLSLLVFPEHAVIKKRRAIFWWIGQRFLIGEELGEVVFDELLKFNLIVSYGNGKCPVVNKFIINPQIRPHLESYVSRENAQHLGFFLRSKSQVYDFDSIVLKQHNVILGDDGDHLRPNSWSWIPSVFNVGASYLNFRSQWLATKKNLQVFQLGRWQDSPSHHIEVGSEEFLKELKDQKPLKYLSLRGISRISELPPSIVQLESLEILDLKACHNLETLPDIESLKSLTHLILSQCYLLEGMPKGIEKLTQLQVLKGFVLGSCRKTPCRISDLVNLKKLRRLSIHIGSEAVIKDGEFESLVELSTLEHLKISWGLSDTMYSDIQIILPSSLKKLHLECFPGNKFPEWLKPSKTPQGLKELNITGGKLESMNMWRMPMEIVRLKYLKHLKIDLTNLKELFPLLRYAEIKQISNHSYIEWSID
ncbi:Disease resistance RPP13-like protein 4, partial [Mucuna pruriens]